MKIEHCWKKNVLVNSERTNRLREKKRQFDETENCPYVQCAAFPDNSISCTNGHSTIVRSALYGLDAHRPSPVDARAQSRRFESKCGALHHCTIAITSGHMIERLCLDNMLLKSRHDDDDDEIVWFVNAADAVDGTRRRTENDPYI